MSFKERQADITAVYKTANGVDLPVKVFLSDDKTKKNKSVLLIHGGGWKDAITDNSEWKGGWMANNAKYLSENGFLSIVISHIGRLCCHRRSQCQICTMTARMR